MSSHKSKHRLPPPQEQEPTPPKPSIAARYGAALERYGTVIAIVLVVIATLRIAGTYPIYSHTGDEPAHIACGMEWLDRGVYRYEAQHPPLARVAAALGPYLLGRRYHGATGRDGMFREGVDILYQGNSYDWTLTASRIGILPFFWIACLVVYAWARRDFGTATAVTALFLFTFLPPVLAHAGLATTDMALTGFLAAAFFAGRVWLERPSLATGAIFGVCGAGAVLSKFSSLAFFPAAAALTLAWYFGTGRIAWKSLPRTVGERLPSFGVAAAIASVLIWACYRFSFGAVDFTHFRLPAPELYRGIQEVFAHNAEGHLSYLFGQVSTKGFLGYYLVVLGVKTPLAFLLLLAAGVVIVARQGRKNPAACIPLAFSAGILLVSFFSRINIGVRHILPVYVGFSIVAAAGLLQLLETGSARRWVPAALALALGWHTLSSALSHPDYLPYFNELAGSHPEKILVDSDLDWGQDMKRLDARLRQGGAKVLTMGSNYFINDAGLSVQVVRGLNPLTPLVGWNAIGLTKWKLTHFGVNPKIPVWPDLIPPQEKIGKSIYLWYFPPSSGLPIE